MGCYPSSLIMPIRSSNLVGWILVFNRQIAFLHISKTNAIQNILLLTMTVGVFLHTLVIMLLTCPLKLSQLGIGEKMSWLHLFLNDDDHQFFTCTNVYFPLLWGDLCISFTYFLDGVFCRIFRQGIIWSDWCLRKKIRTVWSMDWLEGWRVVRRLL